MADSEIYVELNNFEKYDICLFKEVYPALDEEGHDIFCYYDKDMIKYKINDYCDIFYVDQDGYRKTTLKCLHSYVQNPFSTNIYIIGIKDGNVIYMVNIFMS